MAEQDETGIRAGMGEAPMADTTDDARRHVTGTAPADDEWERAERVHAAAEQALAALPPERRSVVAGPVREAVDTLGGLVSIWQGYGEDGSG